MRILSAYARNVKGFSDFAEEFSDVNVISGWNSSGKSSVLDIINALFVTDGDRQLLKVGTDKGELGCVIEDEAGSISIDRTLTTEGISKPSIKRSDGVTVSAYGAFIKSIVDVVTMDPIRRVMEASPKEQAAILLDTVPLELDYNVVVQAVADLAGLRDLAAIVQNARKLPALDAIKSVEDYIYGARRDINRDIKKARTYASEMRASIGPAGDKTDWAAEASRLIGEMRKQAEEETRLRVETEQVYGDAKAEIDRDINEQIAALGRERAKRRELAAGVYQESLGEIELSQRQPREDLKVQHDRATTNAGETQRLTRSKEIADANDAEAKALDERSKAMSKALDSLAATRDKLLENLPIKGLKVEAGQAYLDGVPLQETNTAAQGEFWIRVGVMRAMKKGLGMMLLDNMEHMDDRNFPRILKSCCASGLQFFISRVEPHDLRIDRYESTVEVQTA